MRALGGRRRLGGWEVPVSTWRWLADALEADLARRRVAHATDPVVGLPDVPVTWSPERLAYEVEPFGGVVADIGCYLAVDGFAAISAPPDGWPGPMLAAYAWPQAEIRRLVADAADLRRRMLGHLADRGP